MQKSGHSKMPCTSFFVDDGNTKFLRDILCRGPFFQLPDGFFRQSEGRMRGFPAVYTGIHIEKHPFAVYIKVDVCAKNQDLEQYELSDNSILAGIH